MRLLFFLPLFLYAAYTDPELEALWSSIQDIASPTQEEYRRIEAYLQLGERPYLEGFRLSLEKNPGYFPRYNAIRSLKLLGPNGELPRFEKHLSAEGDAKERCVLLFSTYNSIYPNKARQLIAELRAEGYEGPILLRVGGYPNLPFGGLKLCPIPYAFKAAFLREAQLLGYKKALWLDLAIHPLCNLDLVFSELERTGHFFLNVGSLSDNAPAFLPEGLAACGITEEECGWIPHLSSSMIGLNFEKAQDVQLLDEWLSDTEEFYPNVSWFPEELAFSAAAYRQFCAPYAWFGALVCSENELPFLEHRPTVQFYLDSRR